MILAVVLLCILVIFIAFVDECKQEEKEDELRREAMRSFGLASVKANADFLNSQHQRKIPDEKA